MNLSINSNKIFVALYLSIILVPIFGASDMMATQMLYLQIVNIICFTFLIFKRERGELLDQLTKITSYYPVFIFFCFIIWASITIVKAINLPESFRNLSDQFNYLTAFILMLYNLDQIKNKKNFIVNFFLIILTIEVFTILTLFLLDLSSSSFDFTLRKSSYKGLTGNINIAAFSIVIKLPLLIYKSIYSNKRVHLYNLLLFASGFVVVYLHKTRGAILAIVLVTLGFLVFIIYQKIAHKTFNKKFIPPLITIIFLFLIQSPLNSIFRTGGESTFSRLQTINSIEDQSSAERKRYYKQAFLTMLENPILGIGFGNWELESIKTDSQNIKGYIVPYHAHNDLLELGAETGFIGTLLYFSLLIIVSFQLLIKYLSQKAEADPIYYFLVLCFGVYFCDAMLNFPFARPIQQMNYFGLLAFSTLELKSKLRLSFLSKTKLIPFLKSILILLLILSPFVLYSSIRVYKSYTQHYFLLGYFNYNTYSADIDEILKYEDQYPDIISTTIPIQTLKGLFYTKQKENYKKAIPYFKKGMQVNPYLKLSESMLGFCYLMENKIDSAIYHTENAFNKMPNNPVHFAHYVIALSAKKDIPKMKKARKKISFNDESIDEIYLEAISKVIDKDNSKTILKSLDQKILKSDNDKLKKSYYILEYGKEIVLRAGVANAQAEEFFNNKEYLKAAQKFEEASRLNPLETPYMENAANAYMQAGEDQKALEIVDNILNVVDKNNMKMLYIKTLILLTREEFEQACEYLTILEKSELKIPKAISNKYCN